MKSFALILFTFLSCTAFAKQECLSKEAAVETLLRHQSVVIKQLWEQYQISVCGPKSTRACLNRTQFVQALLATNWSERKETYMGSILYTWTCAAGARCFVHPSVNCAGEVSLLEDGD